jgi:hypothetical protein
MHATGAESGQIRLDNYFSFLRRFGGGSILELRTLHRRCAIDVTANPGRVRLVNFVLNGRVRAKTCTAQRPGLVRRKLDWRRVFIARPTWSLS